MRDITVLLLIFVLFLMALKSREKGMYAYWWFSIFRPHDWVYMDLAALKLPMLATILFILPALIDKYRPQFNNSLAKLIVMFFILQSIATLLNGCSDILIFTTITVFGMFLLFLAVFLTAEIIDSKKTLFLLMLLISLSLSFHSAKAGFNSLTGASYYGQTLLGGFLTGSNALALTTGMMIFLMIFCYKISNRTHLMVLGFSGFSLWWLVKLKPLFVLLIIGSFLYIISSESRGSFIGTIIGFAVLLLLQKKKAKLFIIIILVTMSVLPFVKLPDSFQTRIMSAFVDEEELDHSAASRPHFWSIAMDMAKVHPLGVGTGCYPAYYNVFDTSGGEYGYYRSVHGSHFQILSDIGYVGVVVWFFIFFTAFKKLFRLRARNKENVETNTASFFIFNLSNSLICLLLTFLVGGTFYEFAYNDVIWLVFIFIIILEKLELQSYDQTKKT